MLVDSIHLTPLTASALVLLMVVAGHQYRQNWRFGGPMWKAWAYGTVAGGTLLLLAFLPLRTGA